MGFFVRSQYHGQISFHDMISHTVDCGKIAKNTVTSEKPNPFLEENWISKIEFHGDVMVTKCDFVRIFLFFQGLVIKFARDLVEIDTFDSLFFCSLKMIRRKR